MVASAEGIILNFVLEQNRPLNVQNIADAMQKHGIKKTAIQKVLDNLTASSGIATSSANNAGDAEAPAGAGKGKQVVFKDYGKQRIYIARQDVLDVATPDQLEQTRQRIAGLQEQAVQLREQCSMLEKDHNSLRSSLTLGQMKEQIQSLSIENAELEERLRAVKGATDTVSTEDRKQVDESYDRYVALWRKRKRIFKSLWDTVTENMPRNLQDFQEELGIETDEDAGCSLASFETVLAPAARKSQGLLPLGKRRLSTDSQRQFGKDVSTNAAQKKVAMKAEKGSSKKAKGGKGK